YDGSAAKTISLDLQNQAGLSIDATYGLKIDFTSPSIEPPALADRVLIGSAQGAYATKYCLVSDILSLGSPVTVGNAITFGDGIKDSAQGAASWNNSAAATIAVAYASNNGLRVSGGGSLYVSPDEATAITSIDTANDYVLVYDADAGETRKTAVQYIAAPSVPNALTIGNGLSTYGATFDGSAAKTVAVAAADSTINSAAGGISVLKVPNALAQGAGIQTFSYDGSSASVTVAVDRNTAGGLNFGGSNKLQLDINNMVNGGTPQLSDELAVSFGSNNTAKVDLSTLKALMNAGVVSNTVWVDGGVKAKTTSSISIDSSNRYADGVGMADAFFFVSGSTGSRGTTTRGTSVFGGDVFVSGSVTTCVITGSLTKLCDGTSYLVAGTNVTITSQSNGSVLIESSGGGGGGGGTIDVVSGSTTVSSVDKIDVSKLGVLQSLGSGDVSITGSIGVAEDGAYTDGLFTDFTESTPVGTAVDRFNEVLKGLAPGAAPNLDDADCADSGTAAALSFGSSQSITGYTNVQPSTLTPTNNLSNRDINTTYSSTTTSNDVRVACFAGATIINGKLNADVPADGSNYEQYSFGDGNQGTLKLYVNDNATPVHTTDLSSFGLGNSLNGNGSGFIDLSAATPGHFSDGSDFSTFQHRTGSYQIVVADQRNGWNWSRVVHTVGGTDRTCNYVEWVNDPDANALSSAGSAFDTLSMTGEKKLSGARYNTGGTAQYRIRATNAYKNVYSTSNITFNGTNCSVPAQSFPAIDYASGEDENKVLHITGSATINSDPVLNGSITVSTNVPHPLKSSLSSAGSQSISGILLYNLSNTSTTTSETFRSEVYRLISGSYSAQADVTDSNNTWDSGKHVSGSNAGHSDGLIFYNSRLYAPNQGGVSGDFRNTADGGSITNGPSNNVNYSGISNGTRTFYRY
ncbi:MAG TPA: hypothetical protein DCQ49_10070, partial [Methylophaga sp.]|nr:hypothetical protein [Methylophaga sp.]